jgi:hypothetical protein
MGFWRGDIGFSYLNFYTVICASVGLSFSFTSLPRQRIYCNNKVNNSAINKAFEGERNNWNPYLSLY